VLPACAELRQVIKNSFQLLTSVGQGIEHLQPNRRLGLAMQDAGLLKMAELLGQHFAGNAWNSAFHSTKMKGTSVRNAFQDVNCPTAF